MVSLRVSLALYAERIARPALQNAKPSAGAHSQ
jgi:hypothetical protein